VSGAFVVDSSVAIAWTVVSQSSEQTHHLLDQVSTGASFVVPSLWMFEIANSLLVLARRKRIRPEEFMVARQALSSLHPVVDDEGPRFALGKITDLAEKYKLSVYDAVYLELADRRGLPLASRDYDLNHAARRVGVNTLV
jgi:predicted nucleic acid-binding protein